MGDDRHLKVICPLRHNNNMGRKAWDKGNFSWSILSVRTTQGCRNRRGQSEGETVVTLLKSKSFSSGTLNFEIPDKKRHLQTFCAEEGCMMRYNVSSTFLPRILFEESLVTMTYVHSSVKKKWYQSIKKYGEIIDKFGQGCVICLGEFAKADEVIQLKCKHVYHAQQCLIPALMRRRTCPTCRQAV